MHVWSQIVMGTFVVSFIGNGFVRSAQRTAIFSGGVSSGVRRKILVLLYFTAIVSCVMLFGVMTIPDIIRCCAHPRCPSCASSLHATPGDPSLWVCFA